MSALKQLGKQVHGKTPNLESILPKGLFANRGTLLHRVWQWAA